MVFREPAFRALSDGHVLHGPFPARLRFFGFAAAMAFLGALMTLLALMTETITCPSTGMCTRDGKPAFDRSLVRGAHSEIRKGSKGSTYGVVVIDLQGRRPWESMQLDTEQAATVARDASAAIASGAPFDETMKGPRFIAPFSIGAMLGSLVVLFFALAKMGHFDLIVEPYVRKLRVRRSLFAIPLGTREVSLDHVVGVRVERGVLTPGLKQRYEHDVPAARLVLVTRDGQETPLSAKLFPGHALHLRAAAALRNALAFEPDTLDDGELARIPMRHWDAGMRFTYAWIGVTTGSVIGIAIFGITLVLLGLVNPRANIEGWMMGVGVGLGALGGAALVAHFTRTRLPR